jgi:hypothetical protein
MSKRSTNTAPMGGAARITQPSIGVAEQLLHRHFSISFTLITSRFFSFAYFL